MTTFELFHEVEMDVQKNTHCHGTKKLLNAITYTKRAKARLYFPRKNVFASGIMSC